MKRKKANIEKEITQRNAAAKSLSQGQFQQQIVKPKKGKGSYNRKDRQQDAE